MIWSEYAEDEHRELGARWRSLVRLARRAGVVFKGDALEWSSSPTARARDIPAAVRELRLVAAGLMLASAHLEATANRLEVWK